MSNTFGTAFKITTFGESHGRAVGAVVDGCPSRMPLSESDIQPYLDRRRPGQSSLSTPRKEQDRVAILSGVENGITLGSPISLIVENTDARPGDYSIAQTAPRPSHADFTYRSKYGILASSGGGRSSARETVGRVAAGAVADTFLIRHFGIEIVAWVSAVGDIETPDLTLTPVSRTDVDTTPVRCPHRESADQMIVAIDTVRASGDSIGGIVTCVCRNLPAGWGEPVFDKLHALLGHAMLSIPACKGFEIGSGFSGTRMRGSEHNDSFVMKNDRLGTITNRSGGVQGGISNGEPVVFRVAFKPTATIHRAQSSATYEGENIELSMPGRHDPCVLPRAVPVVEAMAAIVLADAALRHHHS